MIFVTINYRQNIALDQSHVKLTKFVIKSYTSVDANKFE